jgi:hypothetical protein
MLYTTEDTETHYVLLFTDGKSATFRHTHLRNVNINFFFCKWNGKNDQIKSHTQTITYFHQIRDLDNLQEITANTVTAFLFQTS